MKHASLFTGIGGFDLAAAWMGWENVFQVEIDSFCQEVLKHHFPHAQRFTDIRQFDSRPFHGAIDVLSGGDPCQPNSVAGLRAGKADARYLWPEYRRIYNEIKPGYIVNENVSGSISNGVLDQKISDLEADGYTCWPPLVIPAGAAGALHRRDRVWLVAHAMRSGRQQLNPAAKPVEQTEGIVRNNSFGADAFGTTGWSADKSAILRMAYGLPDRLDRRKRIKALGNAVVPQIVYQIFKAIEQYDQSSATI